MAHESLTGFTGPAISWHSQGPGLEFRSSFINSTYWKRLRPTARISKCRTASRCCPGLWCLGVDRSPARESTTTATALRPQLAPTKSFDCNRFRCTVFSRHDAAASGLVPSLVLKIKLHDVGHDQRSRPVGRVGFNATHAGKDVIVQDASHTAPYPPLLQAPQSDVTGRKLVDDDSLG